MADKPKEMFGMDFSPLSTGKKETIKNIKNQERKKRSYMLKQETIKQLDILKIFVYPDYTREQIVEEAIQELYKKKYKKIDLQESED